MTKYRYLTEKEIATLLVYGCSAENWKDIQVAEAFSPQYFQNVYFSGKVTLGVFDKIFELPGGVKKHSGIFNALIHNSEIGNNVLIDKINNYIANYTIEEDAYIENVDVLSVDGASSFGNGVKVAVMIESGGREIEIYDQLSAPLAYLNVFYRHDTAFTSALSNQTKLLIATKKSAKGKIGKNAKLINCGSIKDVNIGASAQLTGVSSLKNGTVISNELAPVELGYGIQCEDFIIQSGSSVTEAAQLTRCFVGQGCQIGKQFSAIDSLFFANCQGLHGEAISIFAGPYTVSHHKSTLMLTALYSFMNAGSGTNFSNHMYKLGPVHQGITERGVKTSSGSYIMWPARIGAFSVVLGKHKGNPDLQYLPFSYLIETDEESNLLPGVNLHSAGTMRDVEKWPKRDMRKDAKIDPVIFDFLSPYTIYKALKGIEILKDLLQNMDKAATFVWYQNCKIKKSSIKKGIELYEMAVDSFIAKNIISEAIPSATGEGEWVDLSGLLAPKAEVEQLCKDIAADTLFINDITERIDQFYMNYPIYVMSFCNSIVKEIYKKEIAELTESERDIITEKGKKADTHLNDMILRDAKKEFNSLSKTGFGIDGDETVKNADFEAVRGNYDTHPFVTERKHD